MAATDQLHFFVGAKAQKLNVRKKLIQFYNHIPHDMEMCRELSQSLTEI